jgi:hypothetical protein
MNRLKKTNGTVFLVFWLGSRKCYFPLFYLAETNGLFLKQIVGYVPRDASPVYM